MQLKTTARNLRVGVVSLAAVGAAGLALASTGTATVEPQTPPPPIAALTSGAVVSLPAPVLASLTSPPATEYGPYVAGARSLPAPGAGPERWTVMPAQDGGACLVIEGGTFTCGSAESIATGRFGLILIDAPQGEAARRAQAANAKAMRDYGSPVKAGPDAQRPDQALVLPTAELGGHAARKGLVADGVTTVQSRDAVGKLIGSAEVQDNLYDLELGQEAVAKTVQLLQADGTIVASFSL